jgi:DNA-binding NtrC family response regulator
MQMVSADRSKEVDPDEPPTGTRFKALEGASSWRETPAAVPQDQARCDRIDPVTRFGKFAGRSPVMRELYQMLDRFAATDVTVMLSGETGVGKDLMARALHARSARSSGPMVVFDCGSVAANLAESELLGHERGAFTGAIGAHQGAFERAHRGTLFLDEIAELPLDLQPRLLRALESRRVRRVGGRVDRPVDVRVIAATHRDLRAEVAAGRFREDLFFRLVVASVRVPPLRERLDELPELSKTLLRDIGREDLGLSEAALAKLRGYSWPGNVRELKNVLTCGAAMADAGVTVLAPQHLRLFGAIRTEQPENRLDGLPLAGHSLDGIEKAAIRQTLRHVAGNKANAARKLGIALSTLYEKLKKFGIDAQPTEEG